MRAIKDTISISNLTAPIAKTATFNSSALDTADFGGNAIIIRTGVLTDGVFAPALQDSPDNVTWTAVDPSNVIGAFGNLASGVDQKVSYIGAQRYVRVAMTVTGAPATGAVIDILAVMNMGRKQP